MNAKECNQLFAETGARVGDRWRTLGSDERAFPELAARALEEAAFDHAHGFETLVEALLLFDPLPHQINADGIFGQPSVTAFRGEAFVIEVLFWLDGLVSIHQHGFSGAFSVFTGSSLHARHRFTEKTRISSAMLIGDLELAGAEFLAPGDVRQIHAGPALIHSTFHLDRPTVTLVVRTEGEQETGPQYDYRYPGLAIDPFHQRRTLQKRLQILRMLHKSEPRLYWPNVQALLKRVDFFSAYFILDQGYSFSEDLADRSRLVGFARSVHGEALDPLLPVLDESAKRRAVVAWRDAQTDDEVRLFLALLLNLSDRRVIFELLKRRFPNEEPVDVVLRCLKKLDFDTEALALSKILLDSPDRGEMRARLACEQVRFKNDYELFEAVRVLREAPGLCRLFGAGEGQRVASTNSE